jgi:eukaryotic-like serine/threonine-protein kinase
VTRIVGRCLRKAPQKRWQSIADVRIALEEFEQDLISGRLAANPAPIATPRRRWIPIVVATLLSAVLTGFAVWRLQPSAPGPELWQVRRLTADSVSLFPAISADGKLVAYISDRAKSDSMDLWVQQIEGGDAVQLTRDLPFCHNPSFSPDGAKIVLTCGVPDSIYVISTLGGLPKKVAEGEFARFSPDGAQIAYLTTVSAVEADWRRSLWLVPSNGGTAKEIKTDKNIYSGPVWSPDGKGLIFGAAGNSSDWYFISPSDASATPTGAVRRVRDAGLGLGRDLSVTADGVLFVNGNFESTNIYRMPFDAKFRTVSGNPVPVIVGAGFSFTPTASQDGRRIAFAVGNNLTTNIRRAPVDPASGKVAHEPVRVTSGMDPSQAPSPSQDGKRIAYLGGPIKAPEVRIRDIATGKDLRLAEAKEWTYVVLSPDGSMVAFNSDQRDNSAIYSVPATGGTPKKICAACGRPVEWSRDRSKLFFDNAGPQRREIHIVDVATGQSKALLQHPEHSLYMPRLSPDGRYLSFSMMRPGAARRIYLAPYTGEPVPEKEWTVLIEGANFERQPFWAPSGNLIYFLSERDGSRCIWAQRVDMATRQPVGAPFAAHHMHQIRDNLEPIPDVAAIGLSVAGGQMFYASFELQSNIWLAERRQPVTR